MSIEEKRPIASMISTVIIFVAYYLIVYNKYMASQLSSTEELKFWGAVMLILIPVMIVGKILIYVLFSIINTIVTNEQESCLQDEFGRLIESKSSRNSHNAFMFGFVLAMGSLVLWHSSFAMFNILLFSILFSSIVQDLSQVYFMRKGISHG